MGENRQKCEWRIQPVGRMPDAIRVLTGVYGKANGSSEYIYRKFRE
jgi:hypothetical protein